MFGLAHPCRHDLTPELREQWRAHLCGLCVGLRDGHGQLARSTTNVDAVAVSVLAEAQMDRRLERTTAGPCPLRSMRSASVISAQESANAHAVGMSLTAAAIGLRDHAEDGDGLPGRAPRIAKRLARSWERKGSRSSARAGFDPTPVLRFAEQSARSEADGALGFDDWVRPSEEAYAAAFAHTAVLAGRPENRDALARAGRMFGRLTYLIDHVTDERQDRERGRFNALVAGWPKPSERRAAARRLFTRAHAELSEAFDELQLTDGRLARVVIVDVLGRRGRRAVGLSHTDACRTGATQSRPPLARGVAAATLVSLGAIFPGPGDGVGGSEQDQLAGLPNEDPLPPPMRRSRFSCCGDCCCDAECCEGCADCGDCCECLECCDC